MSSAPSCSSPESKTLANYTDSVCIATRPHGFAHGSSHFAVFECVRISKVLVLDMQKTAQAVFTGKNRSQFVPVDIQKTAQAVFTGKNRSQI